MHGAVHNPSSSPTPAYGFRNIRIPGTRKLAWEEAEGSM